MGSKWYSVNSKDCHTWETDLLYVEKKNRYLHSAWMKCLISNYKLLTVKFFAETFQIVPNKDKRVGSAV